MRQVLMIALGGSMGAVARYGLSTWISKSLNTLFPWGTLAVNLTGCFIMGVIFELFDSAIVPSGLRSYIAIGFLGAYTTFSTFSLETVQLLRDGEIRIAALNVLASNFLSFLLLALGIFFSRALIQTLHVR
jgi:fluoride exporter